MIGRAFSLIEGIVTETCYLLKQEEETMKSVGSQRQTGSQNAIFISARLCRKNGGWNNK